MLFINKFFFYIDTYFLLSCRFTLLVSYQLKVCCLATRQCSVGSELCVRLVTFRLIVYQGKNISETFNIKRASISDP